MPSSYFEDTFMLGEVRHFYLDVAAAGRAVTKVLGKQGTVI